MTLFSVINQQLAILLVAKFAALAIVVACAEYLVFPHPLQNGGLMSWEVGRLRQPLMVKGATGRVLDWLFSYPRISGLIALRAVIALLILFGPLTIVLNPWLLCVFVLVSMLLTFRNTFGTDGADQMGDLLFVGLAVVGIVTTHLTMNVYLWFLTFQACLAYAMAGFAKAVAPGWRDGTYLVGICGTSTYGNARLRDLLLVRPTLSKWLSRGVIIWECFFPLVLLLPLPLALVPLIGGIVFHLMMAYIMGLNDFVWSFLATYPAVLYCLQVRGW
ncbi:hypothetical protein KSF_075830 [Reticulibacter mediterranei]|uniref:HTTM-like domain-containing protein n=1 Tax=Reticulibacter mediterranei TaxID=2778369 RepID=A0A8J3IS70_9CHLR|nr:hypothetical protein [Reticulibacter mediterranei]GHO97535.1 hypothetical protein KSF_075830 [Reticulibacter mediterranei]